MWTVALAKHMGLSRKEINEMPLYKVMMYYHCINVMNGVNTKWEFADANTPKITLDSINDFLQEI
jgi:hypothetical protein